MSKARVTTSTSQVRRWWIVSRMRLEEDHKNVIINIPKVRQRDDMEVNKRISMTVCHSCSAIVGL